MGELCCTDDSGFRECAGDPEPARPVARMGDVGGTRGGFGWWETGDDWSEGLGRGDYLFLIVLHFFARVCVGPDVEGGWMGLVDGSRFCRHVRMRRANEEPWRVLEVIFKSGLS